MFMNMNIELLCKSTDVDIDGCTLSQEVIFSLINVNIHIYQKLSYKKQELLTIREHLGSPMVFWCSTCCLSGPPISNSWIYDCL
jgi:hypothetical protein